MCSLFMTMNQVCSNCLRGETCKLLNFPLNLMVDPFKGKSNYSRFFFHILGKITNDCTCVIVSKWHSIVKFNCIAVAPHAYFYESLIPKLFFKKASRQLPMIFQVILLEMVTLITLTPTCRFKSALLRLNWVLQCICRTQLTYAFTIHVRPIRRKGENKPQTMHE